VVEEAVIAITMEKEEAEEEEEEEEEEKAEEEKAEVEEKGQPHIKMHRIFTG